jgi:phosphatidate phosphatase APP1
MHGWKKAVALIASNVDDFFDEAKLRLKSRLGLGKLLIIPYLGYGTPQAVHLRGRVLRDNGITIATDNDSVWTNLLNMYRRYASEEIPRARVRATFNGSQQETVTDNEGYFTFAFTPETPPDPSAIWHDIALELLDYPGKEQNPEGDAEVRATGKVIIPPPDAQFGVISDIDDTVMRTDMLNLISMASNTFLNNARTRLPFEGVAAFYDALRRGSDENITNPIFYVSSSPWNLYDLISDFFVVRGIPTGPLFLVDLGIEPDKLITSGHHAHKSKTIQTLLDAYPHLPFLLIGDSGQKDPEIYLDVVQKNPGRIRTVYIRDVTSGERDTAVGTIIEQITKSGTEMVFAPDTLGASNHALERGYILPEKLPEIREEREQDKQAQTPLEQALQPEKTKEQS